MVEVVSPGPPVWEAFISGFSSEIGPNALELLFIKVFFYKSNELGPGGSS
jgi:hypothetical protein